MNCYLHSDTPATAYCRSCGRALCAVCQRTVEGVVYCQDHVPVPVYAAQPGYAGQAPYTAQPGAGPYAAASANPYIQPPPAASNFNNSPILAFILGWIPGVGAIYNGQYVKGLVHAAIFGLLVSLISTGDEAAAPFLGITLAAFVFYMPFEAYHTAKRQQLGMPVDELSSLAGAGRSTSRAPIGPIVLILIGIIFLLDTLHLIEFRQVGRFWPVLLIVIGIYMLYGRLAALRARSGTGQDYGTGATRADQPLGATRDQ